MIRRVGVAHACAVLLAAFCAVGAAQEMRRGGGGNGLPPYDVAKERTVAGEVTGTDSSAMQNGPAFFVLSLDVAGKPLQVLVGPQEWVEESTKTKNVVFAKGSKVEATGNAEGLKYKGDAAMIVRQIKVAGKTFIVRDASGVPVWEK